MTHIFLLWFLTSVSADISNNSHFRWKWCYVYNFIFYCPIRMSFGKMVLYNNLSWWLVPNDLNLWSLILCDVTTIYQNISKNIQKSTFFHLQVWAVLCHPSCDIHLMGAKYDIHLMGTKFWWIEMTSQRKQRSKIKIKLL